MRAVLVALLIPLAGCLAEVPETSDVEVPVPVVGLPEALPAFEALSFAPSMILGKPAGYGIGGEPSVAVADDGTIYVTAPMIAYGQLATGIGQGRIWKSTDDGATFTLLNGADGRLTDEGAGNGDTDIATGLDGTVHFVDLGGGVPYLRSDDAGASWNYEGVLNQEGRPVDRQWIDARGDVVVATWAAQDGSPRGITFTISQDAGKTWSDPKDIVDGMIQLGPVAIGPDNTIIQPYVKSAGYALRILVSRDLGATWDDVDTGVAFRMPVTTPLAWSPTLIFPVAAFDAMGNIAMVWSSYKDDAGGALHYAWSQDGSTWSKPIEIMAAGNNLLPWVVGGAPGQFAAFWYHADLSGDPNVGPRVWDLRSAALLHSATENTQVHAIVEDTVHIGGVCTLGGGCLLGNTPIFNDRTLLDFFEADVTPDGHVVLSWTATSAEGARNPEVRFTRQDAGGLIGLAQP